MNASPCAHASQPRCRRAGFTLIEVMIMLFIVGLLAALGGYGWRRIKADARKKACVAYQDQLWQAKIAAWGEFDDLNGRDGNADILAFMDPLNLKTCPNPGAHQVVPPAQVTQADLLRSYDLSPNDETTRPRCLIDPTHVHD